MKVLLAPDSFKGSLSAKQVCDAMERGIRRVCPQTEVISIPMADGGEGSVDAILAALGGERITLRVTGPRKMQIDSFYGILPGNVAIIEMAAAAGLPLMEGNLDALGATTMGVGELMRDAIARGCKTIVLALGGSATNDGGCGAAAALGAHFFNAKGECFVPVGGTLEQIVKMDLSALDHALCGVSVIAMCDVDNPLCGPQGAAAVFAPQKGASGLEIPILDRGLSHLAALLRERNPIIEHLPGGGAAGGMGAGAVAFFSAQLKRGIETVLDLCRFDQQLAGAALVLTGEGRIDAQTLRGKTVAGVANRARAAGVPVVALTGCVEDPIDAVYQEGVCAVFGIHRKALPLAEAFRESAMSIEYTTADVMRLFCR